MTTKPVFTIVPVEKPKLVAVDLAPPPASKAEIASVGDSSAATASSIDAVAPVVPYVDHRPDGLSTKATLINFLNGMIGPGCLSLPLGFQQGGLVGGAILVVVLGFLNNYCMLQLCECSQHLARRKGRVLDYGNVAYEACANSFKGFRRYKHVLKFMCNGSIVALQVGICAVLCVFILEHVRQIVEEHSGFRASTATWNCLLLAPLIAVNVIRTLRTLVGFSSFGNVVMLIALVYIVQYLIRQPHDLSHLPLFTSVDGFLVASCTVLYSFEGQALILPMENKIRSPRKMLGPFGVLSQGMLIVTLLYVLLGLLGYSTYGEKVEGSISLNLPDTMETTVLKAIFVVTVYSGFGLQQYVIVDMTWPFLREKLGLETSVWWKSYSSEAVFRTCLLLFELMISIVVPTLDELIPFVGATVGMLLALAFPAIIHSLTFAPEWAAESRPDRWNWRLIGGLSRNGALLLVGLICGGAGLRFNISEILQRHVA
ncbi:Aa-trans domain-containing protein [Aphelenchoides fujianensis]|nr:Aa-trans domain-containing protein [Aphelenchoides fujianensis]